MKKAFIIAAVVLAVAVSGQAAESDQLIVSVPISFKGKLTNKTLVTDATLATAAGGGSLTYAIVQVIGDNAFSASGTDTAFQVIGTSIVLTNVISGSSTDTFVIGNSLYVSDDAVVTSGGGPKPLKFISAFSQDGEIVDTGGFFNGSSIANLESTISNSVLLVTSTLSDTKSTNVNSKVQGIWVAGKTAVTGSIKTAK